MSAILLSLMLLGAAAQVQTRETPTTRLFVQTTPAGATIKLDGKAEGTAPKVFLVPPDANKMTVEVELEGHASQRREVVIQGGRVTRIEFQLAPQQAKSPAGSPSGFHNAPDDAQLAAKDPSGPRARSLAEAVRVFNARAAEDSIGKSQSPLTEDEVIAAIRWSLLEIDKLAVSDKTIQALRGIIDSRELPPRFELEVLTVFEPNDQMEVTEWSVRLRIPAEPHGSTCIGIREQMVGSRLFGDEERNVIAKWQEKWRKDGIILLGFDREYEDERAKAAEIDRSRKTPDGEHTAAAPAPGVVSLAEAVRVFNARAAENSIGKSQSPLTEDEVIAAIRWSLLDTKKLPVSDKTLQSLKSIPDFRELPSGFDVEVMTCFQPDSQTAFTKWSVRLRIPAEPRSTTDIVIRDQMIAARFSDATAKTEPLNRQQPEAEFSRARELFEKGYVSESEYDKAKHDWNQTPAAAVRRFFDAVRQGDGRAVEAMMTSRAQQQFQQTGALVRPVANATASYELGDVERVDNENARVKVRWIDTDPGTQGRQIQMTCLVRKDVEGWRVRGITYSFAEGQPPVVLDLEDLPDLMRKLSGQAGCAAVPVPGKAAPNGAMAGKEDLLRTRRDTLRQALEAAEARCRSGNVALESVLRTAKELLDVELRLAKTKAERIELCETTVAKLREMENLAQARVDAGIESGGELLGAKAARLAAEERLLQDRTAHE